MKLDPPHTTPSNLASLPAPTQCPRWCHHLIFTAPTASFSQSLRATLFQIIVVVLGAFGLVLLLLCAVARLYDPLVLLCCALPLVALAWWLNRRGHWGGIWLVLAVSIVGIVLGVPATIVDRTDIVVPLLFVLPPLLAAIFLHPHDALLVGAMLIGSATCHLALAHIDPATIATFDAFAAVNIATVVAPTLVVLARLDRAFEREAAANRELRALNASLDMEVAARTREVVEVNAALERTNAALQQVNASQAQWLDARRDHTANVAHDQKAELEALLMAELAHSAVPAALRQAHAAQVQANVDALDHLVTALLTAAQLESHALTLVVVPVDVRSTVAAVVQRLEPMCRQAGMALSFDAPPTPQVALADRVQLGRMLVNLVDNARKYHYRPDSGHLGGQPPTITVSIQMADGAGLRIIVSDNGPGIANVRAVMSRWRRGTESVAGTGLGLSLCAALAHEMGGRLELQSTPGAGTTASLVLTVVPAQECAVLSEAHVIF